MNPSADPFVLTSTERAILIQQVVDHVAEAPPTKKAARTGLFFAAGVAAIAGIDRETFLNAAAADFDEAKQGAR